LDNGELPGRASMMEEAFCCSGVWVDNARIPILLDKREAGRTASWIVSTVSDIN
jgi:hypothetical protein